jgi:hypothetical protein
MKPEQAREMAQAFLSGAPCSWLTDSIVNVDALRDALLAVDRKAREECAGIADSHHALFRSTKCPTWDTACDLIGAAIRASIAGEGKNG